MKIKSFHVGVAAEAIVAGQFARCGYDVSVQYGANQPEYDLLVSKDDKFLKVSVKGSQDGGWGLTQSFKKGLTYFECSQNWLNTHGSRTVFCLVQFKNIDLNSMPNIYLATPLQIKIALDDSRNKNGETVLREYHKWGRGIGVGTVDKIPDEWKFSIERINEIFNLLDQA